MDSSLYATSRLILTKIAIFALAAASLVFSAQSAKADSTLAVGVNPTAVAVDAQGNAYTANFGSGTISKISSTGQVSTFADLNPQKPRSLAIGPDGNLYVGNKTGLINKISPTGTIQTFATVGKNPVALIFDSAGNLYTANNTDSSVSKVTASGAVSLFAKVGTWPSAIAMDSLGNIYTTSYLDGIVSKVTPAGQVSQFATVGSYPSGLVIDTSNNLYVTNSADNTISKVTPAGTDSVFATVGKSPSAIAIDSNGNLFTANYLDNTISKVTSSGLVSTFAITGNGPTALHLVANSNLYVANYLENSVSLISPTSAYPTAPRFFQAVNATSTQVELSWQSPLSDYGSVITDYLVEATTNNGNTLLATYRVGSNSTSFTFPGLCSRQNYQLRAYAINGSGFSPASNQITVSPPDGPAAFPVNISPTLIRGTSVALGWEAPSCNGGGAVTDYRVSYSSDAGQNWVTVSRPVSTTTSQTITGLVIGRNYLIRVASVNSFGVGTTSAPILVTTAESSSTYNTGSAPAAVVHDALGNTYVANTVDNTITKITTGGVVSRFATIGENPAAMAFDASGNLFVANSDDGTISKVTPQGVATVFATVGDRPTSLVFDKSGNLYSADSLAGYISKITPTGEVSIFAALASNPVALVIDASGNLYSANGRDSTVAKITSTGEISVLARLPIAASRMVSDVFGNLYVFSTVETSIYKITPSGQLSVFMTLADSVTDLVIDSKNNFYLANSTNGTVSKITSAGTLSTIAVFEDSIVRIATDSNGSLYTSFAEDKVVKSSLGKTASAPRSPTVSQVTSSTLTLSWQAPETDGGSALTDYLVERSINEGAWSALTKQTSTATNLQVTGLDPSTNYRFRIAAVNGPGISNYSTVVSATTSEQALSSPRNLAASQITATTMLLSWQTPLTTGGQAVSNYLVEYSPDSGSTWLTYPKPVSSGTSLNLSDLQPGKTYLLRVSAITASATSDPSAILSATTLASVPSQPRSITFSAVTKTSLSVNWLAPLTNNGSEVVNYQVEMISNSGSTWTKIDRTVSTNTSTLVSGLSAGSTYQFRVFAINSVGISESSETKSITTAQASIPSAPANLTFTNIRTNSISLSWTAVVSSPRVTNYVVEISRDGSIWSAVPKKTSTITSLVIGNLLPGYNYKLRVAALNPEGQSAFREGSVTTLATLPTAPAKPTATEITSSSLALSWTAPNNGGAEITNYLVEISGGGSTWAAINKPISTSTSLEITGLKVATKYSFRVRAVNAVGASKVSPVLTIATLAKKPESPVNLFLKSGTVSSAAISWTAPAGGGARVTDYLVEVSIDNGQSWITIVKAASSSTTFTLRGLKSKTSYLVRVSAKNSVGYSTPSQNLEVVTP